MFGLIDDPNTDSNTAHPPTNPGPDSTASAHQRLGAAEAPTQLHRSHHHSQGDGVQGANDVFLPDGSDRVTLRLVVAADRSSLRPPRSSGRDYQVVNVTRFHMPQQLNAKAMGSSASRLADAAREGDAVTVTSILYSDTENAAALVAYRDEVRPLGGLPTL